MLNYRNQVLAVAVLVCWWVLTGVNLFAFNAPENEQQASGKTEAPFLNNALEAVADFPVYLYFADNNNQYLLGEERDGLGAGDPVLFCRQIMNALIQGPHSGLVPTMPLATEIRAIYIDEKTAYVDFTREIAVSHSGGILSELMTIYSIVNTLVLNVDGVDQVKILIGGQEAETLSGHIDIRFPLNADMLLIR
ncbi:MAG: GerMN domain-containing protein [Desulfobacteraceae bacterium]|jgi:hypothetical protein|nr:GerMN domain-containing protein [Desulfobacteraceae bacterium]